MGNATDEEHCLRGADCSVAASETFQSLQSLQRLAQTHLAKLKCPDLPLADNNVYVFPVLTAQTGIISQLFGHALTQHFRFGIEAGLRAGRLFGTEAPLNIRASHEINSGADTRPN